VCGLQTAGATAQLENEAEAEHGPVTSIPYRTATGNPRGRLRCKWGLEGTNNIELHLTAIAFETKSGFIWLTISTNGAILPTRHLLNAA
jgi:hypothetical protein